jgi:hypothetical protein
MFFQGTLQKKIEFHNSSSNAEMFFQGTLQKKIEFHNLSSNAEMFFHGTLQKKMEFHNSSFQKNLLPNKGSKKFSSSEWSYLS